MELSMSGISGITECVKTGAHIYVEQYGEWAYGDMHKLGSVYIMRVCQIHHKPLRQKRHYTVGNVGAWFDRPKEDAPSHQVHQPNSTLLIDARFIEEHGYEGKDDPEYSIGQ